MSKPPVPKGPGSVKALIARYEAIEGRRESSSSLGESGNGGSGSSRRKGHHGRGRGGSRGKKGSKKPDLPDALNGGSGGGEGKGGGLKKKNAKMEQKAKNAPPAFKICGSEWLTSPAEQSVVAWRDAFIRHGIEPGVGPTWNATPILMTHGTEAVDVVASEANGWTIVTFRGVDKGGVTQAVLPSGHPVSVMDAFSGAIEDRSLVGFRSFKVYILAHDSSVKGFKRTLLTPAPYYSTEDSSTAPVDEQSDGDASTDGKPKELREATWQPFESKWPLPADSTAQEPDVGLTGAMRSCIDNGFYTVLFHGDDLHAALAGMSKELDQSGITDDVIHQKGPSTQRVFFSPYLIRGLDFSPALNRVAQQTPPLAVDPKTRAAVKEWLDGDVSCLTLVGGPERRDVALEFAARPPEGTTLAGVYVVDRREPETLKSRNLVSTIVRQVVGWLRVNCGKTEMELSRIVTDTMTTGMYSAAEGVWRNFLTRLPPSVDSERRALVVVDGGEVDPHIDRSCVGILGGGLMSMTIRPWLKILVTCDPAPKEVHRVEYAMHASSVYLPGYGPGYVPSPPPAPVPSSSVFVAACKAIYGSQPMDFVERIAQACVGIGPIEHPSLYPEVFETAVMSGSSLVRSEVEVDAETLERAHGVISVLLVRDSPMYSNYRSYSRECWALHLAQAPDKVFHAVVETSLSVMPFSALSQLNEVIRACALYGRADLLAAAYGMRRKGVGNMAAQPLAPVCTDNVGRSDLWLACVRGHAECVRVMVAEDSSVSTASATRTPTHIPTSTPVNAAARHGHVDVLQVLFEQSRFIADWGAAFVSAVDGGNMKSVKWILANVKTSIGPASLAKSLWRASGFGYHHVLEYLLKEEKIELPEVVGVVRDGHPMSMACRGHVRCMELILEETPDAQELLTTPFQTTGATLGAVAVCRAIDNGSLDAVQYLVEKYDVPIDQKEGHAIHVAAHQGRLKMLKYLHGIAVARGKKGVLGDVAKGRTVLGSAALAGRAEVLRWLLATDGGNRKCDVSVPSTSSSDMPIQEAIDASYFEVVKILWAAGARGLTRSGADAPRSALSWAVSRGHVKLMEWILEDDQRGRGDVFTKDPSGSRQLPMHVACTSGHIGALSRLVKVMEEKVAAKEATLDEGKTKVVDLTDQNGRCSLEVALGQSHFHVVKWLLEKKNASLTNLFMGVDKWVETLCARGVHGAVKWLVKQPGNKFEAGMLLGLRRACASGYVHVVKTLLGPGGMKVEDADKPGPRDRTAMFDAVMSGNIAIVDFLLELGSKSLTLVDADKISPLMQSVMTSRWEMLARILEHPDGKASLDKADNRGRTVLWYCAYKGSIRGVELCMDAGTKAVETECAINFPPYNMNNAKSCVLLAALQSRIGTCAEAMFERWPVFKKQILKTDSNGWSALHWAASRCGEKAIEWVMKVAPLLSVDVVSTDGQTPLMCATLSQNSGSISKLLSLGARLDVENKSGETVVFKACETASQFVMGILLKEAPAAVVDMFWRKDVNGRTPFWVLCRVGDHRAGFIRWLFTQVEPRELPVDEPDHYGVTPMLVAARYSFARIVDVLRKEGKSQAVYMCDSLGQSPVSIARLTRGVLLEFLLDVEGLEDAEWDANTDTEDFDEIDLADFHDEVPELPADDDDEDDEDDLLALLFGG